MDKNGYVFLLKCTDDDFDWLYEVDKQRNKVNHDQFLKVKDRNLLPALWSGSYYSSNQLEELKNVWWFGVQKSKVEWSLANDKRVDALGTENDEHSGPSAIDLGFDFQYLNWHIHNHNAVGEFSRNYITGEIMNSVTPSYNKFDGSPADNPGKEYMNAYFQHKAM